MWDGMGATVDPSDFGIMTGGVGITAAVIPGSQSQITQVIPNHPWRYVSGVFFWHSRAWQFRSLF